MADGMEHTGDIQLGEVEGHMCIVAKINRGEKRRPKMPSLIRI
jgi:hypothetical protein